MEAPPLEITTTTTLMWVDTPPNGACVHLDLVYTPAVARVDGHPGARSMGTNLVGVVSLENGELVFVTSTVRPMEEETRATIERLRRLPIVGSDDKEMKRTAVLAFGTAPNPDSDDGTFVGTFWTLRSVVQLDAEPNRVYARRAPGRRRRPRRPTSRTRRDVR